MGGLAGFIGTYLIGPRVGIFSNDDKYSFILEDQLLDEDGNDYEIFDRKCEEQIKKGAQTKD